MDTTQINAVLGILGAYFAIVFVLAVSVETILEPFTSLPWLKKTANPDDILNDIKEWLPEGSELIAKAKTIEGFTKDARLTEEKMLKGVSDLKQITDETTKSLGLDAEMTKLRTDLALKFAALRRKYVTSEKNRIAILRVLAGVIGVGIAVFLSIDTFDILGSLFPADVRAILVQPNAQIGGMIVTGLAASAGSSFWHDMLGHVRNLKEGVQQVSQLQVIQSKDQ
jgi:hypothetical protein